MKKLILAIDWISIWSGKVVSVLALVVCFSITTEVIMRYLFHAPTSWGSEIMCMSSAVLYIMGGAWTVYTKRHIQMELIYSKLSRKNRAIIDSITFVFFVFYVGFLLWGSAIFSWESIRLGETSASPFNPPIYPVKIALTLGTFLILLQGIATFVRNLHFIIKGEEL